MRHIPIVGATTSWALRPSAGFKPSTKNLRHLGQTETDVGAYFPSSHTLPNLIMNGCPIESVNIIFEVCVNIVNLTVRCDTARNWGCGWAAVKTWREDRKEKKKRQEIKGVNACEKRSQGCCFSYRHGWEVVKVRKIHTLTHVYKPIYSQNVHTRTQTRSRLILWFLDTFNKPPLQPPKHTWDL